MVKMNIKEIYFCFQLALVVKNRKYLEIGIVDNKLTTGKCNHKFHTKYKMIKKI